MSKFSRNDYRTGSKRPGTRGPGMSTLRPRDEETQAADLEAQNEVVEAAATAPAEAEAEDERNLDNPGPRGEEISIPLEDLVDNAEMDLAELEDGEAEVEVADNLETKEVEAPVMGGQVFERPNSLGSVDM